MAVWRWNSAVPISAPLEAHLESALSILPILHMDNLPKGCWRVLNIGVLFSGPMTSLQIQPRFAELLSRYAVTMEISAYPCMEESPAEI